jgi:hypothetical protein
VESEVATFLVATDDGKIDLLFVFTVAISLLVILSILLRFSFGSRKAEGRKEKVSASLGLHEPFLKNRVFLTCSQPPNSSGSASY